MLSIRHCFKHFWSLTFCSTIYSSNKTMDPKFMETQDWLGRQPFQRKEWNGWATLQLLKLLIITRSYFTKDMTETQLHVFCDSSKLSYGTEAFLRGRSDNMVKLTFVLAKNKVVHIKMQTLVALNYQVNISQYLKSIPEFLNNNCKITLWSDSQIVLSWLPAKKKLQPYIQNPVSKINEMTSPHKWKLCPTSENPVDISTRGLTMHKTTQRQ